MRIQLREDFIHELRSQNGGEFLSLWIGNWKLHPGGSDLGCGIPSPGSECLINSTGHEAISKGQETLQIHFQKVFVAELITSVNRSKGEPFMQDQEDAGESKGPGNSKSGTPSSLHWLRWSPRSAMERVQQWQSATRNACHHPTLVAGHRISPMTTGRTGTSL